MGRCGDGAAALSDAPTGTTTWKSVTFPGSIVRAAFHRRMTDVVMPGIQKATRRKPVPRLSRRQFVLGSAGVLFAARTLAQSGRLTARQVLDRLRAAGPAMPGNTADGFKAGDPSAVVTGIAVSLMATMRHLQWAVERGHNLVISYEPVFYSPNDDPGTRASDPIYLAKKKFIDDQRLVVCRMFDQWNALHGRRVR